MCAVCHVVSLTGEPTMSADRLDRHSAALKFAVGRTRCSSAKREKPSGTFTRYCMAEENQYCTHCESREGQVRR